MEEFKGTTEEWRYSSEFMQVTTSRVGVIEGSKRVCNVANSLIPDDVVHANGTLIAGVQDLLNGCIKARDLCNKLQFPTEQELNELKEVLNKAITKALK